MAVPESKIKMMYPGEYLEAEDLRGNTVVVTITDINAKELEFEKGKKRAFLLTFTGKKKALLLNVTNAHMIAAIHGENPNQWRGKRIALYPTTTRLGADTVPCIRVWGSPDQAADIKFRKKIGYKMVSTTLHKSVPTGDVKQAAPEEHDDEPEIDPGPFDVAILEAWSILGWSLEQGGKHITAEGRDGYLDKLSGLIDQQNAD
jgi:hypothetical protein